MNKEATVTVAGGETLLEKARKLAVEFDGRVKYQRQRYGRTPEEELWREKRTEDALRSLGSQVLHKVGAGAVVQLGALLDGKVSLVAYCSPEAIKAGQAAGKLIGALTAKLGGKGGGKPDYAQGGGGDASKLAEVLKL